MRGEFVRILFNDKPVKEIYNIKLLDEHIELPFVSMIDFNKFMLGYVAEKDEIQLQINGEDHREFPYLDPSFKLENLSLPPYCAILEINGR